MKQANKLILLSLLMPFSVISMGFSSFLVGEPISQTALIETSMGDVYDTSNYISFTKQLSAINYTRYGFLYDETFSGTLRLNATVSVDLTSLRTYASNLLTGNSLGLTFLLIERGNVGIINSYFNTNSSASFSVTDNLSNSVSFTIENPSKSQTQATTNISAESISTKASTLKVDVNYAIDTSSTDFSTLYSSLQKVIFNLGVSLY